MTEVNEKDTRTEYLMTRMVRQEIENKWVELVAKQKRNLPRFSMQLIDYLNEKESTLTSDFVLRRYIQKQKSTTAGADGKKPLSELLKEVERESGETLADMSASKNICWSPRQTEILAGKLYSYYDKQITKQQWIDYLSIPMTLHRASVFKIALIAGMNISDTQQLLLASGKEPYNCRSAHDLIYWYYMQQPIAPDRAKRAKDACECYDEYLRKKGKAAPALEKNKSIPAGGEQTKYVQQMAEKPLNEDEFLRNMKANSDLFIGYSQTALSAYYQFSRYLYCLYHEYESNLCIDRDENGKLIYEMLPIPLNSKMLFVKEGEKLCAKKRDVPDMNKLLTAMFQESNWYAGNKRSGKTDKKVKKAQPNTVEEIQSFCETYKARCFKIERGMQSIEKQDILLLSYFFIVEYSRLSEDARSRIRDPEMDELARDNTDVDSALTNVRAKLRNPADLRKDAYHTLIWCLEQILEAFGFKEGIYLPSLIDRFFVINLLYLITSFNENGARSLYDPYKVSQAFMKIIKKNREEENNKADGTASTV